MTAERPNILWLVSEDCPPHFGCYGDALAVTPNLDRLAQRGVLFEQAFCPVPVCAPSRFSLLTGLASESHAPAQHMRAEAAVPPWTTTYPQALRDLGYYCTNNAKTDYKSDVVPDDVWDDSSARTHGRNRPAGAVRSAGRHLLAHLDGSYSPGTRVFTWARPGT